jgi:hypothetical protein
MDKRRSWVVLVVVSVLIVACSLFASPGSNATPQDKGDSTQPASPSAQPSSESPVVEENIFPLTPDPINVTATLDTEHAATYKKGSYTQSVKTESADGTSFELYLMNDTLLKENENGELSIDYDSTITMTPVSAIEGLPFSQGYLAAVHLGPDGAKLVDSADLTMEIPGEYDPSTLIGFAADGTGDDLHLYPATFYSSDGKTYATFTVVHFSLYGVAQVVQSEIVAQRKHPPVKLASQIEQELAPLPTKKDFEDGLKRVYDQTIDPKIRNLDKTPCNVVPGVVYDHNAWVFKVVTAGLTETFYDTMQLDRNAMLNRLTECVKVTCDTCMNPKPGVKPEKRKVELMVTMMLYARELSVFLDAGDAKITNWWLLANKCAKAAGLPQQAAGIAADGGGSVPKATCP